MTSGKQSLRPACAARRLGETSGGQEPVTAFLGGRLGRHSLLQSPCRRGSIENEIGVSGWRTVASS
jgi:hypothetical protein